MTKREEIRRGMSDIIDDCSCEDCSSGEMLNMLLIYQDSKGVVIKTEVIGDAPLTFVKCWDGYYNELIAVEPLIKEKT